MNVQELQHISSVDLKKLKAKAKNATMAQLNQAYQNQTLSDEILQGALQGAPVMDVIKIKVTKFVAILSSFTLGDIAKLTTDAKKKKQNSVSLLSKHELTINGYGPLKEGESMASHIVFEPGVPKIVQITVTDGKAQNKRAGNGKPKFAYYPVGIAFLRNKAGKVTLEAKKAGTGSAPATIARDDFSEAKAFLFGGNMYFTLSPKFKQNDLNKYAVIVQRAVDGQVGVIDPNYPDPAGH